MSEPLTTGTIDALIGINNLLQQPDSAIGILTYAQKMHDIEIKESWYEKLGRWEDGLAAFERKQNEDPASIMALVGRMKCLQGLGEWESLSQLAREKWVTVTEDVKRVIAPTAAAASWGLGALDEIEGYISVMKQESTDCSFFKAILSIHRNLFQQAKHFIDKAREQVDVELMTNLNDSYTRAYKHDFKFNTVLLSEYKC